MLLINFSPRQFTNCRAFLLVLSLLCARGRQEPSPYPPKLASSHIPARTSQLVNTFSISPRQMVLTPGNSLLFGSVYTRAISVVRSSVSPRMLSNASLIMPAPTPISISVSPTRASLYPNQTLQFTAAIRGTIDHAVKWLVEGHEGGDESVGTVSATGVYTAPPGPAPWPSVTITAVSADEAEAFGSAVVMIMPGTTALIR
jgi:hypothetical protein